MVLWTYNCLYIYIKLHHLKNQMHYCSFSSPVPPLPEASWLSKAYRYDSRSCQTSSTGKARPEQGHSRSDLNHVFLRRLRKTVSETAVKQPLVPKESPHFISPGFWSGLAAHVNASWVVHMNSWAKPSRRQPTIGLLSQKQISICLQTALDSYQSLPP